MQVALASGVAVLIVFFSIYLLLGISALFDRHSTPIMVFAVAYVAAMVAAAIVFVVVLPIHFLFVWLGFTSIVHYIGAGTTIGSSLVLIFIMTGSHSGWVMLLIASVFGLIAALCAAAFWYIAVHRA